MLSAMYENGGNTTHRLFDGHKSIYVYPFESQLGTKFVNDFLSGMYPAKYRWPIFPTSASTGELHDMIIDEECKVRAKTPFVSKFRDADFTFSDTERKERFQQYLSNKVLQRGTVLEAFFVATFQAWKNYKTSGKETFYMGYSPIVGVDGDKIIRDYNGAAYVLHIVRNPFSAFAETKRRPVPLSLDHYITAWILCQQRALMHKTAYPDNFFVVRYEDIINNPPHALEGMLEKLKLEQSETLLYPSWNGTRLTEVYPWGTIRMPTEETNKETAQQLTKKEMQEIHLRTNVYLDQFGYRAFSRKLL